METKRVLVKVCKQDIKEGIPNNSNSCPIARRLHKMGYTNYTVGGFNVYDEFTSVASLPKSASKFIGRFDEKGPNGVKPINFYLRLPSSGTQSA